MGTLRRRSLIVAGVLAGVFAGGVALWRLAALLPAGEPFNANSQTIGALSRETAELSTRWGDAAESERFRLVLPESRVKPEGNRIEVAFERLRTTAETPLPAVFVLAGGPGSSGIDLGESEYFYFFREIQKVADVVLIDQRGTGRSVPNLRISDDFDLATDIVEGTEAGVVAAVQSRLRKSIDHFRSKGIDVAAYNSRENADDLEEIRAKLGYDKITLLGYGYGTELSMVYLDRHPQRVAGAVWFGPLAPDLALKLPGQVQHLFEGLERLIAEDRRLRKRIPSLTGAMKSVHASLQAHPVPVSVALVDGMGEDTPAFVKGVFSAASGLKPNWNMTVGSQHLELVVQDYIRSNDWAARFPAFFGGVAQGKYGETGNLLRDLRRRPMLNAVLLTTSCTTGYTDARWTLALAGQSNSALSVAALNFGRERAFCDSVGLSALGGDFLRPITSEVPVMFIAGTLDGRASIENLPELERRFPNHVTITVENGSHNRLLDNAIRDGVLAFLRGEGPPDRVVRRKIVFESPVPYETSVAELLDEVLERDGREAAVVHFKALFAQHADDEEYQCDISEDGLNDYGYGLIARGRPEDAVAMFRLNVELHPDSWNAHDSLGDGLLTVGQAEEAQRSYEKSIEIYFLNVHGRGRLRDIQS